MKTTICSILFCLLTIAYCFSQPTITCPGNQNRNTDTNQCLYITAGTEFDPTAFTGTGVTISYVICGSTSGSGSNSMAGVALIKGTNPIQWTVTDNVMSTATCSFTVFVYDGINPSVICPSDQIRDTNAGTNTYTTVGSEFNAITFADNCGSASLGYTLSGVTTGLGIATLTGTVFNMGVTTVTWNATDVGGNIGTCTFNVCVNTGITISGNIFWDTNINGIKDTGDLPVPGRMVEIVNESMFYTSHNDGSFAIVRDTGTYTIKCLPIHNWHFTTDSIITLHVSDTTTHIESINFGLLTQPFISDVSADITADVARANKDVKHWLTYRNEASIPKSGFVELKIDPLTTFVSSVPPPASQNGNIISWNYANLIPLEQRQIILYLHMPDVGNIGDTLTMIAFIDPVTGDVAPVNNYDTLSPVIFAPIDPNDKLVDKGTGPQGYTLMDEELEYTIRFQNTGNDTAFLVKVRDTINMNMDMESLRIISSSHNMLLDVQGHNIVTFIFEDIMLPDSNIDEAGSHGFVKYAIKPKPGLADSTVVTNAAYIYFDYNPAVPTNQTINTFVTGATSVDETATESDVYLYPNPATNKITVLIPNLFLHDGLISISNIHGQLVIQQAIMLQKTEIDLSGLAKGVYILKFIAEKKSFVRKIIKD
jgi:uncharacterized repeat protein (TIGR01451 family)